MDDFLVIEGLLIHRQDGGIGQNVIQEISTYRTRITKISHLQRCHPRGKGAKPRILRIALKINGDINPSLARRGNDRTIRKPGAFMEMIHGGAGARAHRIFTLWPVGKGVDFESIAVVGFKHADQQMHGGVVVQISREIADPQLVARRGGRGLGCRRKRQGFTRIGARGNLVQFRIIANAKQREGVGGILPRTHAIQQKLPLFRQAAPIPAPLLRIDQG